VSILNSLISKGIISGRGWNLAEVRDQIERVEWVLDSTHRPVSSASSRRTAFCQQGAFKVIVRSETDIPIDKSRLNLIALHEGLCAVGIADHNYVYSISLAILESTDSENLETLLSSTAFGLVLVNLGIELSEKQTKEIRVVGGSSLVVGGGDETAAFIKLLVYYEILKKEDGVDGDFPRDFNRMPFEPGLSQQVEARILPLSMRDMSVSSRGRFIHMQLDLFLPVHRWDMDSTSHAEIIADAVNYVIAVRPAAQWVDGIQVLESCKTLNFGLSGGTRLSPRAEKLVAPVRREFHQICRNGINP